MRRRGCWPFSAGIKPPHRRKHSLNAVNLAVDIVWRFGGLPREFYADWISVAREEGLHFRLLRAHLQSLGFDYGDFPAHNGLWAMAEKTLEARGRTHPRP